MSQGRHGVMYTLPCLSGPPAQARPDGAALGSKTNVEVIDFTLCHHVQLLYMDIRCQDCSSHESRVQRQAVMRENKRPMQGEQTARDDCTLLYVSDAKQTWMEHSHLLSQFSSKLGADVKLACTIS